MEARVTQTAHLCDRWSKKLPITSKIKERASTGTVEGNFNLPVLLVFLCHVLHVTLHRFYLHKAEEIYTRPGDIKQASLSFL